MRIVLSWLREFVPTELSAEDLAELITRQGVKVEEVLRPWAGLDGVVVARVNEVRDHPDSDKLCVARVDDGTGEQVVWSACGTSPPATSCRGRNRARVCRSSRIPSGRGSSAASSPTGCSARRAS